MNKKTKEILKTSKEILSNKKFQIGITVLIFLIILISSTSLRLGNLDLLKDSTTGKYIPADPDACYELRVAQTLLEKGTINGVDTMRNPGLNVTFAQEMLPKMLVMTYKTLHAVGSSITLDQVDVLYPVAAFALGLIIFFILCWYLSSSKVAATIASALLAYSTSYLSRTTGGVSSHESLGMPFMFLAMLVFAISLSRFGKSWKETILWGVGNGVAFAFSFWSWSGASNFVFMIFPIASIVYYLFGVDEKDLAKKQKMIVFTFCWIVASTVLMPSFGYHFSEMYQKFISNYGIATSVFFVFSIVDYLILRYEGKMKFAKSKYRLLYSLLITIIAGFVGLFIIGKNPFTMIKAIYTQILFPFGLARVNLTVAYYQQPYISDLISQYTPVIFWLFVIGMIFIGVETAKGIKSRKHKFGFILSWTIAVLGMMFSRTSETSIFNGTSLISQLAYIVSFGIFAAYFGWLYFNDKFNVESKNIFLFAWMFVMLLSTRSAVRVIFVIYTFVAFAVAYAIIQLYEKSKSLKDSSLRTVSIIAAIVALILVLISLFGNPLANTSGSYQITKYGAAGMGPIANDQWQLAMSWVRNNTNPADIFVHWWDYGYQIQLLGNRTTVLDGGNYNVYWNYMMGRYVLTTPKPETAFSFMKTHNVSYLVIDPSDLGKYGAYSKIGSDLNWDRFSSPTAMVVDNTQSRETATGNTLVYTGGSFVDEDINYNGSFIPGPTYDTNGIASYKAYIAGVIVNIGTMNKTGTVIGQPTAVYIYNNNQYRIPVRYVYFNGQIMDFRSGIDSTFRLMPEVSQSSTGQISINAVGAGIYLSPRVSNSLFAQVYLMGDPLNKYPTLQESVSEDDYVVKALKQQGANIGDMIYFNGFRGPVKIWKVNYPIGTEAHSEFMATDGIYGSEDKLFA
ncbi:Dolichyl-monophosphooligosaccharide--protein glycotransferase AglB [uncultured archaeon]|nr:Dolichyl-monophosphooligosaccharide--protein glycotransferase AglB [uncultured archaeon]